MDRADLRLRLVLGRALNVRNLLWLQLEEVVLAQVPQLRLVAVACRRQQVLPWVELRIVELSWALAIKVSLLEVDAEVSVVLERLDLGACGSHGHVPSAVVEHHVELG